MEMLREMNVSAESVMNHIKASLRYELDQYGQAGMELKEGIRYTKPLSNKLGKTGDIEVHIARLNDKEYVAEFYSNQGLNRVEYVIEALGDQQCRVIYRENFEGTSNTNSLNYRLMSTLFKRRGQKRVKLFFDALEKHLSEQEA